MSVSIERVSCEHFLSGFGIDTPSPRLSWRFKGDVKDWKQQSYELRIETLGTTQEYHVESEESILVPWPASSLRSRQHAQVTVRAIGIDGTPTSWAGLSIEAALLTPSDWSAKVISCPPQSEDETKPPFFVRRRFNLESVKSARVYATALGIYELEINGRRVGDQVLTPGWTSYDHRLHYQAYDVTDMLKVGENVLGGYIGEGWWSGRLGFEGGARNMWGTRNGLLAQLEVDGSPVVVTDESWEWTIGAHDAGEIYDGEIYDSRKLEPDWSTIASAKAGWKPVEIISPATGELIVDRAPIRRTQEVQAVEVIITPSGKTVVDFGQNLVGWCRLNVNPTGPAGSNITLTHAEVLEHGELGIRPLRVAKCRDVLTLGGDLAGWEPKFTFHGFRYVQVDGWSGLKPADLTAIVVHTDMERTGTFESSHPMVNKLHQNIVWGMRGNFVGLPTDCPQRDERLGWTGDLQVFGRTANFLYDTSNMLSGWLQDMQAETLANNGVVPVVIPDAVSRMWKTNPFNMAFAIWGDVAILAPYDLFEASGDIGILKAQYEGMKAWLHEGIGRREDGMWKDDLKQLGDWLDPDAPPDSPGRAKTDEVLVANAYLVHVTRRMSIIANYLGLADESKRYAEETLRIRKIFQQMYVTPFGRLVSDSQTAFALALQFDLLEPAQRTVAIERLSELVKRNIFKVGTGFAGTPLILDTLASNDQLHLAYRMLQEKQCPSWLYCVSMGATTIWERWDSMRPDGTINPGEMTSFNHYSLGAVANFMHATIGGISPLEPGWKKTLIAPKPGGTLTGAKVGFLSPYGQVGCQWVIEGGRLLVDIQVPPNTTAKVVLPGVDEEVGSGERHYQVVWKADERWPPKPIWMAMAPPIDEIA
ncbi:putative rhamnosidase [Naematelia encephala]|uniref:alpha-L-rhamnosidase n=1 Tax=Naematelia encephala TaxID=71784 RepID=A0A1Y2AMJ1_9TREE|nr:putative rhamnosidase [Naematelia encephala]